METSSRRKACDTCFKKKIKCDMLKPACSNCLLYKVPCGTTVIRRRVAPVVQRESRAASTTADGDGLEARLARIEAKLDRIGDPNGATGHLVHVFWSATGILPTASLRYCLIEDYFRDFNTALPLFHQQHFMQMLLDFYSEQEPTKKSRAVWAAINVVLALGFRIRTVETDEIIVRFDDIKIKHCIDNAQKELDELVTREEDTLGIEVLLGLVLLFQTNTDQKPASVLISTAVRLAHRLGLHMKSTLSQYSPEVARHRSNIFWLCYYLDKVNQTSLS
ncbi:putative fungal specific transcription factor domain-containing protein [Daldinia childiae]|uniref:putative fungal specific transcription factor domain-containing protein n=1 Tax=Daldinia childiae TaxID=326645 RepID=UPI001446AB6E|nr:putative fungal specific transcription factor domain-containing protein [Daldinia childiae]KAF3058207.1 putative fungal specific transcription factor domain-containing protein [Daldinia childiae]